MKYYSAVLGVFKNEATFLPSWIRHYLSRGIEHIYLLDDSSTDDYMDRISGLLSESITLKHVEPGDLDTEMKWRQAYLYNKYFGHAIDDCFWLGVFDLDEFFYCPLTTDLNSLLRDFEPGRHQELLGDWYWFGSNGLEDQPEDVPGSFVMRASKFSREYRYEKIGYHPEWCCKSFGKTKNMVEIRHHFNKYNLNGSELCTEGKKNNDDFSLNLSAAGMCYVNHYIGARGYYTKKKERGSCNNSLIVRDENLYKLLNKNEVLDVRLKEQNERKDACSNTKHGVPF